MSSATHMETAAPNGLTKFAKITFWGNLVCQIGIIFTGGVVRLSKSGLACPTWPGCHYDSFVPQVTPEAEFRPFIEAGNRLLTFVLLIFAILVVVVTLKQLRSRGTGFFVLALIPLVGTILQAIIGMVTVLFHLHPGVVGPHFLLSPILVAISTVLLYRLYEGNSPRVRLYQTALYPLYWVLASVGAVVLVLGVVVTGSGPNSGDTNPRARLPFEPRSVAWLHADAVMVFVGLSVALLVGLYLIKAHQSSIKAAWTLIGVCIAQGILGYTQYFLGVPKPLVALHLLMAGVFAAAVTYAGCSLYSWGKLDPKPQVND